MCIRDRVYISWLILLVGSSVAFYVQHPEYVVPSRRSGDMSIRQQEDLALGIMTVLAQRYYEGRRPLSASEFVARLRVQIQGVTRVLRALRTAGLITENSEDPPRYLPTAPLEKVTVREVLEAVRKEGGDGIIRVRTRSELGAVAEVRKSIDQAVNDALAEMSVKDMARVTVEEPERAPHADKVEQT